MYKFAFLLIMSIASALAGASDIDKVSGNYIYSEYRLFTANGKQLGLKDIGARQVTMEIRRNNTLVMNMVMLNGAVTTTTAKVTKINIDGNSGYWIAQWPDMDYPVRSDFEFDKSSLSYSISFQVQRDTVRYGMSEKATLTKQK